MAPEYLVRIRDTMEHRGPDGAGLWIGQHGTIGLAHRRLAIVDLTAAADQPMENEDGSVRVVFNGEIYNHAEIRRELERGGRHRWRTDHSDTEVILHAFEEWGIECVHRFRGMFAFALWDARSRELWLVRDRIGVKPVYHVVHHGRLVFASEIKALLADPEQPRAIDEEALFHYLSFLTTPAPNTLFAGIRKLEAGTWLRATPDGRIEERRYWDAWDHVEPFTDASEAEIEERVLAELRTAVRLRKMSDVPVGVFLSGGVDSSTNAALFAEGETRPIQTFSIGYDKHYASYPSELPYARRMASLVGADHHERCLSMKDLTDLVPRMTWLQDEPIADPVCVPLYYVAKLARDAGVIVCQVGEGSDELFWGYASWKRMLRLQSLADTPGAALVARGARLGLHAVGRGAGWREEWLRRAGRGEPVFWSGAESFTDAEKRMLLSPRLCQRFAGLTSWDAISPIRRRFEDAAWERSTLHWMSYVDLRLRLPELLLMRVDKMTMGVGLEARVPFLDHKFVELVLGIPSRTKTRNGQSKRVLKRAVRGLIPDDLLNRPKQGFGVPVHEWSAGELGAEMTAAVRELTRMTDLLDPRTVDQFLGPNRGPQSWVLYNLASWWKAFLN